MTGKRSLVGVGFSLGVVGFLLLVVNNHQHSSVYTNNNSNNNNNNTRRRQLSNDPKTVEEKNSWKRDLFHRLNIIRATCGDLCSITDEDTYLAKVIPVPNGAFPRIEANVDCDAIIGNADIDACDPTVPYPPPKELMPFYTLDGMIHFNEFKKLQNTYLGGKALENRWTQQDVEDQIRAAATGTLPGTYGIPQTNVVRDQLAQANLTGKTVLVIGSEKPWLEAICLHLGAIMVTTLEYGAIHSEHPQLKTMTPATFRLAYQNGSLGQFDMIVSFSSLEHSGLGRYGDALNPWGDILGVARAWCVTKPGGQMFLGLPSGPVDSVEFNAHRIYGEKRWPLIATNWRQTDIGLKRTAMGGGTGYLFEKMNENGNINLSLTPE